MVERHLREHGIKRVIRLHVGYLSAVPQTLLQTEMVASLPTALANILAQTPRWW